MSEGVNLRVRTIQTLLESKLDCTTFESVSDLLDDIMILSDAKDIALIEDKDETIVVIDFKTKQINK